MRAGMEAIWGAACGQAPTYDMLPCGSEALESLRIEAGIPRYGQELGEDVIPLEAGPSQRGQLQQGLLHRAGNCGARPQPRPRELETDRFDRECRASRFRRARRRWWKEEKWRKSPAPAYRPHLANLSPSGMYGASSPSPAPNLPLHPALPRKLWLCRSSPPRRIT